MDQTLMPNLYSGPHYNGSELNWREQLQIDDRATIRLGVARIRQQRIKEGNITLSSSSPERQCSNQWQIVHYKDAYRLQ